MGTFFSKEFVLKKVLRLNDAEIDEMSQQMQRELEVDPDDGGVTVPDGGDGVTRYPQDSQGMIVKKADMPDYEEPDKDEPEQKPEEETLT